jgi:hypothetical protein
MRILYMLFAMIASFAPVFILLGILLYLTISELNKTAPAQFFILAATISSFYYLVKLFADVHAWFYLNLYYKKEKFNENGKDYIRKTNLLGVSFTKHKGKLHYEDGLAICLQEPLSYNKKSSWNQYWFDGVEFNASNFKEFKEEILKYKLKKSIQGF